METITLVLAGVAALSSVIAAIIQTVRTWTLRERYRKEFENYAEQLESQLEEANRVIESQRSESEAVRKAKQRLEERLRELRSEIETRKTRKFAVEAEIVSASSGTATASGYLSEVLRDEGIQSISPEPPLIVRASRRPPSDIQEFHPTRTTLDSGELFPFGPEKDEESAADQPDSDPGDSVNSEDSASRSLGRSD